MSDVEKEDKPIELNSWVRLMINDDEWVRMDRGWPNCNFDYHWYSPLV